MKLIVNGAIFLGLLLTPVVCQVAAFVVLPYHGVIYFNKCDNLKNADTPAIWYTTC
jgi:hypothetical protein